jgi:hypothetical protein
MPRPERGMDTGRVIPLNAHDCPACGRPMALVSAVPRFGGFPELRTFECKSCGVAYTEAVTPGDHSAPLDES